MGYGGALIYSALARNIRERFPEKKVVFVYPLTLDELIWRRAASDRVVWKNNPEIDLVVMRPLWYVLRWFYPKNMTAVVNIDDPGCFYWIEDQKDRIEYKRGRHAIQIACDVYGIDTATLRPRIILTRKEKSRAKTVLDTHGLTPGSYVCVEPNTKGTFTPNKAWFFDRWQELVHRLSQTFKERGLDITLAQVGAPHSDVLHGVVDITGTTSFRETAYILSQARLLVSTEGGLAHLNAAVDSPAVVLISAMLPGELMAYPQHTNLFADQSCVCQGLKKPCPRGRACMGVITVDDVIGAIRSAMR